MRSAVDPGLLGPLAAVDLEVELARRVRVAVDREHAAQVAGELESASVGGSRRSGRELISTATLVLRAGLRTRPWRRTATRGRSPRLPFTRRPVQCPSTLVRGLRTAPIIRLRHRRRRPSSGLECTLATLYVEPRQQLVVLVEGAVVEDVDLDALQAAGERAAQVVVDRIHDAELAGRAARR